MEHSLDKTTLLSVYTNKDIEERELSQKAADALLAEPAISDLLAYVKCQYDTAVRERENSGVTSSLLDCLRRRNGEYSPSDKARYEQQGSSTVFVPLTEQKCNGAEAWMSDVLMPYGDKIWAMDPTKLPELPENMVQRAAAKAMENALLQLQATGSLPSPAEVEEMARQLREAVEEGVYKEAKRTAERMEDTIEDQLKESDWSRVFKDFLSNVVTFGTGVLKGPVVREVRTLEWEGDKPVVGLTAKPQVEAPSPLDLFPSPQATEVDDGYIVERQHVSPGDLLALKELEFYQTSEIERLLAANPTPSISSTPHQHDSERADLEQKPDREDEGDRMLEILEFWGPVPGKMLRGWGVTDVEDHVDYDFQVIWSGDYVVKVMPNPDPLGRRPYHKAVYKRTLGSFWGRGVPQLMASSQDRANAAVRSLINNMGLASGPQVVIDIDRVPAGEDITHIFPWKVWQITNEQNLTTKAIEFNQPRSNAKELMEVFLQAVKDAELESGVPAYTLTGDSMAGVGRTASGLSMLMNASSRGIKEAFSNIDLRAVGPLVERFYVWNMLYNEDETIKGDLQVVTRGATGMLLREIQLQKVNEFLDRTNNPVDQQILGVEGRTRLLRDMAALMSMENKDIVPSDQELARRQREAQAQMQSAQMQQQLQASQAGGGPNTLGTTPVQEGAEVSPGL